MTLNEALQVLDNVVANIRGTRVERNQLEQALQVVVMATQKNQEKGKGKKDGGPKSELSKSVLPNQ
jgi:hypothetical protein